MVPDCIEVTDPPVENNDDSTKGGQLESTVTTEGSGSCETNGISEGDKSESDDSDDESDDESDGAEEMSDDSYEDEE
jgi:hypothetical protein